MQEEEIVTNTVPHHNDDVNNQDNYQVIIKYNIDHGAMQEEEIILMGEVASQQIFRSKKKNKN